MGRSAFSTTARNDALTALNNDAATAVIKTYDGPQPTDSDTAPTGSNHVLATHTAPATFGDVAGAVLTARAITAVAIAIQGIANWFRVFEANGVTALFDGNIGVLNGAVTLSAPAAQNAVSIAVNATTTPLFAGQDLWFNDGGTMKKASITANAAVGVTALTVSALAAAISTGLTSVASATVNSPSFQVGAQASFSTLTITAPAAGT